MVSGGIACEGFLSPAAETGGGSEVVGSSNPQMYDSVYFDSDSEEEDTAGKTHTDAA